MLSVGAILFVGSFPPRECGVATFTKDVVDSYDRLTGSRSSVVAIDDPSGCAYRYGPEVVNRINQDVRASYYSAAAFANRHPSAVVNIQHEFGLFGGEYGEWCLDFMHAVSKPIALTMHTVLPRPASSQLALTQRLCEGAARVIVLAETGRDLLIDTYGVAPEKIAVIPHGVPDVAYQPSSAPKAALGLSGRTVVSTFGLLSSGKGLEHAIEAVARVAPNHPNILYLILGATHPVVVRSEGERYRSSLQAQIDELGMHEHIRMIDRYLGLDELIAYLLATDVYLTPYLNADQIVSGTLAYALGAGKAIVSTPYLYARELLANGRGLLARFRDPDSLAEAMTQLLADPALRSQIAERAYAYGRHMIWEVVATDYARVINELAAMQLVSSDR